MVTTVSKETTLKLLTAMGRALGHNVDIRSRRGRKPSVMSDFSEVLSDSEVSTRKRRRRNHTIRRQFREAQNIEDVLRGFAHIHEQRRKNKKYLANWTTETVRELLPAKLQSMELPTL